MTVNPPTSDELRRAREQASAALGSAWEYARTPLMAVLGAGDLAARTARDALHTAREQVSQHAGAARKTARDIPVEVGDLRGRLDPAELRRLLGGYARAATDVYASLAEHGTETWQRLRANPQLRQVLAEIESRLEAAEQRAADAADETRELADDVLGRVSRRDGQAATPPDTATTNGAAARGGTKPATERPGTAAGKPKSASRGTSGGRRRSGASGAARRSGSSRTAKPRGKPRVAGEGD